MDDGSEFPERIMFKDIVYDENTRELTCAFEMDDLESTIFDGIETIKAHWTFSHDYCDFEGST